MPRREPSFGASTPRRWGPSSRRPQSGLPADAACTSWSYWRTIHSLLQTAWSDSTASSALPQSRSGGSMGFFEPRRDVDGLARAHGQALVQEVQVEVGVLRAAILDDEALAVREVTEHGRFAGFFAADCSRRSSFCSGTATTMRSCASLIQISHGAMP
jgi:hypothetical protein